MKYTIEDIKKCARSSEEITKQLTDFGKEYVEYLGFTEHYIYCKCFDEEGFYLVAENQRGWETDFHLSLDKLQMSPVAVAKQEEEQRMLEEKREEEEKESRHRDYELKQLAYLKNKYENTTGENTNTNTSV